MIKKWFVYLILGFISLASAQTPDVTLDKTITSGALWEAVTGRTITYEYLLTNSGGTTLNAPYTVADDKVTVTCPSTPTSLAPSETVTCTASYTTIQTDVDTGTVTNIATATIDGTDSNTDSATATSTPFVSFLPAIYMILFEEVAAIFKKINGVDVAKIDSINVADVVTVNGVQLSN